MRAKLIAVMIFILCCFFTYTYIQTLIKKIDESRRELDATKKQLKEEAARTSLFKAAVEKKAEIEKQHIQKISEVENERKKLESCIANRTCVHTVRVRVPTENTDNKTCAPQSANAELDEAAQRAYTDLATAIKLAEQRDKLWSESYRELEDYCFN